MLQLYSFPQTRGVRVTWACIELDIDYEYNIVNLYKLEHKSPEYKAITPTQKVPAIVDGEVNIAESGAILTYLADKAGKLIPEVNSPLRAKYEEFMFFVLTELEQPLWTQAKHKFALPENKRIPQAIELGEWEFQKALKVFGTMLGENQYVLGDEFSVADIVAGHTLSWAQGFEQKIELDNVKEYASRVLTRPALKQARAHEKELKDQIK